jgi:hypothetical protein
MAIYRLITINLRDNAREYDEIEANTFREAIQQAFFRPYSDFNDPTIVEDIDSIISSFREEFNCWIDESNEELQYILFKPM